MMLALIFLPSSLLAVSLGIGRSATPILSADCVGRLRSDGWVVVDDFCSPATVRSLVAEFGALQAAGRFSVAGVGEAGSTKRIDNSVRRCEQCFVFPKGRQPGFDLNALYNTVDGLQAALHDSAGKPLDGLLTEGLFASYPNGGYYRRHVDAATGTTSALRAW